VLAPRRDRAGGVDASARVDLVRGGGDHVAVVGDEAAKFEHVDLRL
jgi:hypothetical protein